MEANQQKLHRELMKELLARNPKTAGKGKVTATTYRTMSWEKRSRAIFFYLHESLGNRNMELTCSLFGINIWTLRTGLPGTRTQCMISGSTTLSCQLFLTSYPLFLKTIAANMRMLTLQAKWKLTQSSLMVHLQIKELYLLFPLDQMELGKCS